jgi:predicted site-specific integrase-resolvase
MANVSDALTITEVSRMWGVNRSTVRYHIDRGNFQTRITAGGRFLIERASVEAMWGPPKKQ